MSLQLHSSAFPPGSPIPTEFTCEGRDVSPPLRWDGIPPATRTLALVVDDPDAPDPAAPRHTWVHWLLFNIPPDTTELPENAAGGRLPGGATQGLNDWQRSGYGGPCPPRGRHRYIFRLYALDRPIPINAVSKPALLRAMEGHVLDQCELVGTYERKR